MNSMQRSEHPPFHLKEHDVLYRLYDGQYIAFSVLMNNLLLYVFPYVQGNNQTKIQSKINIREFYLKHLVIVYS